MTDFVLDEILNDTLLNDAYTRINDGQADEQAVKKAMDDLQLGLRARRLESSDQEWDEFVYLCVRHPLKDLLHQDPFTRRAYAKPRGYSGDAELLDLIFAREERWPLPEGTSPLGQKIFNCTTGGAVGEGMRARRSFVAETIDRLALEVNRPRILAISAGHLREVNLSGAVKQKKIGKYVAIDSDTESLEEVDRSYSCYGVEIIPATVQQLLSGSKDIGPFDLIYSTGLFDYLQHEAAQHFASVMFQMLSAGGRFLVASFLPEIRDIGYLESYMDWNLIYRTPQEMLGVAMVIPQSEIKDIRLLAAENQNMLFLQVTKR